MPAERGDDKRLSGKGSRWRHIITGKGDAGGDGPTGKLIYPTRTGTKSSKYHTAASVGGFVQPCVLCHQKYRHLSEQNRLLPLASLW